MKGRWSSSGGFGCMGPGDETRLTTGGGLERGVAGRDERVFFREGVLGMELRGRGTLKRPLPRPREGVSGTLPESCEANSCYQQLYYVLSSLLSLREFASMRMPSRLLVHCSTCSDEGFLEGATQ